MARYAKAMTKEELKARLTEEARKFDYEKYDCERPDDDDEIEFDCYMALQLCPHKDFKVKFNDENCGDLEYYDVNGFAVALSCAGGDWEYPVNFAIYIDDKNHLRAYIPTYGNTFNVYMMTALGSEDVYGIREPEKYMPKELWNSCSELEQWQTQVNNEESVEHMLQDIASRICVPGNDTIPLPKGASFPYYKGIKPKKTSLADKEARRAKKLAMIQRAMNALPQL